MPEKSKFILLLDNWTAHTLEFEQQSGNISVLYLLPTVTPLIQAVDQGDIQEVLLLVRFPLPACELQRNVKRLSTHAHYHRCCFLLCLCMEFSEDKNSVPSLEEIVASCNDC
jgi:hypothetical protein